MSCFALDYLSKDAQKAVDYAKREAWRTNYPYVSTSHLLIGLARVGTTVAIHLEEQEIGSTMLWKTVSDVIKPNFGYSEMKDWPLTSNCEKVIDMAQFKMKEDGLKEITTVHLFEAIKKLNCSGSDILEKLNYVDLPINDD